MAIFSWAPYRASSSLTVMIVSALFTYAKHNSQSHTAHFIHHYRVKALFATEDVDDV